MRDLRANLRAGVLPPMESSPFAQDHQRRRWETLRLYAVLYGLALVGVVAVLALGGLFHAG